MTSINLDHQPEAVRQFVLGLSTSTDGAVLESEGRPVACLVPPPQNGSQDGTWTESMNDRRCALIDRKYDQGLSPTEAAELATLQDAMARFVDRVAPQPLDEARRLLQDLLNKAKAAQPGGAT